MRLSAKLLGPIIFFSVFKSAETVRYLHNAFENFSPQTLGGIANPNSSLPKIPKWNKNSWKH